MAGSRSGISRRVLFERAGLVLAQLPGFLAGKGWLEDAYAQSADVVRQTLDALVAFKRLFVADNSALPNALGGPNPTLTTQALATRTAEKIFQLYFGGDPWVRTESPMSSINDRVTKGVLAQKL